jgi:hypothetical protein
MSEHIEIAETFKDAGTRPIESEHIEIAETFKDAGTRPIAQSPDYLVPERSEQERDSNNSQSETPST